MKIVETNTRSYFDINMDYIVDTQTRIIECESWDKYISYFTEYNGEAAGDYISIDGNFRGIVVPKWAKICDLEYNDHKLSCTILTFTNDTIRKSAGIVQ